MSEYYRNEPLSCGHFTSDDEPEAFWTILPVDGERPISGTACVHCAVLTEECGGTSDIIPTNDQMLDWLANDLAGISSD